MGERAVQVDRPPVARLAQQRDHPLRLAQAVGAHDVAALGEQLARAQQPRHLGRGRRVAEHRQAEGRLGDQHVAGHRREARAGRVRPALVVARVDDPPPLVLEHHLRRAQHVPGRRQPDRHPADLDRLAPGQRPLHPARPLAQPGRMIASVSGVASTSPWPGRAWSLCPWLTTARATARKGSTWNPPGRTKRPSGRTSSQRLGCKRRPLPAEPRRMSSRRSRPATAARPPYPGAAAARLTVRKPSRRGTLPPALLWWRRRFGGRGDRPRPPFSAPPHGHHPHQSTP